MQATQSIEYNNALNYAVIEANKLNKPVLVFFGLTETYPEANERHYYFMMEGLKEVSSALSDGYNVCNPKEFTRHRSH
jgi:deoxyribodipyrimidine photo-lyase